MRTFPQELVDKVIDELVELYDYNIRCIVPYSLISKAWVVRAQQHHFERVSFVGSDKLRRWCRRITPNPAGVSRHTRLLVLSEIDTLEGFEAHIRAFTRVDEMTIMECTFLLSPSVADCFAPMGPSLTQLWICDSEATSRTIISLLAELSRLRSFTALGFKVTDDAGGTNLIFRIPFFEGNNSVELYSHEDQRDFPGPPDWIPPSARFGDLEIDITYFLHKAIIVNQWLSSSCTTLTSLTINGYPDGKCRPQDKMYISMHPADIVVSR